MKKHVTCSPISKDYGCHRFLHRGLAPNLSAWRCNLTALSQRHNLYFLAAIDTIHVYQPVFPNQNLPNEPDLIIHPPETGHRGLGIDPWEPHSINRILVEYLGNEEILLVACDDGDVIGYRTEVIYRALEGRDNRNEPASEDGVHVFLHQNVGASAWGLAVHREARIIAISANTHQITIIAYALAERTEEADISTNKNQESSKPVPQFPFWRQNETVFQLSTTNNLPSLSFYHPSGRWLLSSCIDGKTILWDLHTRREAVTYQFGWCKSAEDVSSIPRYESVGFTCACPAASNVLHGAWGTIALDTRSAYYLSCAEEQDLELKDIPHSFWDVTAQKKRFTAEPLDPGIPYIFSESENDASDLDDDETDSIEEQTQETQPFDSVEENEDSSQDEAIQNAPQQQFSLSNLPQLPNRIPFNEAPMPESDLQPYSVIRLSGHLKHNTEDEDLEDPFVILTKEDIFLVQRPFTTNMQSPSNHIMSMRRPLHPGEWQPSLSAADRHCFFAQIPELGVFIIGSPIGRVAVFSLYWTKDEGAPHRRYGFKLEYLLPFEKENENKITGSRIGRLVGVAVSPIQSMFDRPGGTTGTTTPEQGVYRPRRWRLLMYTMDHTLMSYELSKPRESESPDPEDLVI